ncbi:MAG: hypothetical protein J5716_07750 [Alphaproteobacteria bacterium]|nr:hypothetical protein [Alphaproteobacteria bacterium]
MKKDFFLKKIKIGENKRVFVLGMLFSDKKRMPDGYIDRRFFGLLKAKKKSHIIKYFIAGLPVWKKNTEKWDFIEEEIEKIGKFRTQSNLNVINLFLSGDSDNENLFYIQVPEVLFVFSKEIFKQDKTFIKNFLLKNASQKEFMKFGIMPKESKLYQEHIAGFKSRHVLMYKYAKRVGLVCRSVITCSPSNNDLFFEGKYLGLENYRIYHGIKCQDTSKRKIFQ